MRILVAVLAFSLLVGACSSDDDGERAKPTDGSNAPVAVIEPGGDEGERLAAARARWDAAGIDSYTWSYTRTCFCPRITAEVRVEDGAVVDEVIEPDFGTGPQFDFSTMEGLFDLIEAELGRSEAVVVEYRPDTGQVASVFIDRMSNAFDDESTYEVQSFVPVDQQHPDLATG